MRRLLTFVSILGCIGLMAALAGAQVDDPSGPTEVGIGVGETVVIEGGPLVADGGNSITPASCVEPNPSCDHYRVTMALDDNPDALNFLVATLEWDVVRTPPLALVAAGLASLAVPDLDMYYYPADFDFEDPDAENDTSGATASQPERIGYTVQDGVGVIDVIINGYIATGTTYTLTMYFSNELFEAPVEIRPPEFRPGTQTPGPPTPSPVEIAIPPSDGPLRLDPITDGDDTAATPVPFPIEVDPDFAGTGLSVSDQLGASPIDLSNAQPAVAPAGDERGIDLVLWLLLAPLVVVTLGGYLFYRRRPAALQVD